MTSFPHLPLLNKISGKYKPRRGGGSNDKNEITLSNLRNRDSHGKSLKRSLDLISDDWNNNLTERKKKNLPQIINPTTIPVYLQIDTDLFNPESLKSFGIELISEEEDGYIIGASGDNFKSLKEKIDLFINNTPNKKLKDKAAQLWQIVSGTQWRRDHILSADLNDKWDQINDDDEFLIDIGVACYIKFSEEPIKDENEEQKKFVKRHNTWQKKWEQQCIERGNLELERQNQLQKLVSGYNGEIVNNEFIDFGDSFCCQIRINGVGLKDLILTYPYLFEISETETLVMTSASENNDENYTVELESPDEYSPEICVIDSGILETHKLLSKAIIKSKSKSYIPNDSTVDDAVIHGHGTKVAGAVLYGSTIPKIGNFKLPFYLINARILDGNNTLSNKLFPPSLMEKIVNDFPDSKIFNLSVNSWRSCPVTHMSQWASAIDKYAFEKKILFIISTGNISSDHGHLISPGVKSHLHNGRIYPNYLFENSSRIANPSQSCFAITVGSICHNSFDEIDKKSFGSFGQPSAFTRTGLGMWGMVKPDVVEFGGDYALEKNSNPNISIHADISPELVKKGLSAVGKDDVGTSFSAPKVSHIGGYLQKMFPHESVLTYRALIVQSARYPNNLVHNPTLDLIKTLGYGIPDLKRATENSKDRITFIADGNLAAKQANIYKVKIPPEINRPGLDYDILVEVTLSYYAKTRRTRKGTKSYLSTWLDWESSGLNESSNDFKDRIIEEMDSAISANSQSADSISWKIQTRINAGVRNVRRQDSTLQKDWAILKSNVLPNEFCIAVIGHNGWENILSTEIPYSLAISFEVLDSENQIDLYQSIQAINIETEIEQRVL
jgi:hypothetical protein